MKWLAIILLMLAVNPALSEPENQSEMVFPVPTSMICTPVPPDDLLQQRFGELEFVNGVAQLFLGDGSIVEGELLMFVNPDTRTFTVLFHSGELYCAIITGTYLEPAYLGEPT